MQKNYQLMVLIELLRKRKGYQHVQSYFHSYCWYLNDLLQLLKPSLYFTLTVKFDYPFQYQFILLLVMVASNCLILALSVLSFSLPWFIFCFNHLILVSSPCCGFLLLVTFSLQYHFASPCCVCLILLIVTTIFSLSLCLLVIFFFLSLCLVDIYFPILVATVYLPCQYHFSYPCQKILLFFRVFFSLSRFLLFSLSWLAAHLSLSLHLLVVLLSLSLILVDIYFPILVAIVSLPHQYHFAYPCYNIIILFLCLFLVLITFLPLFTIVGALLLIVIALILPLFLFFWSTIINTKHYDKGSTSEKY